LRFLFFARKKRAGLKKLAPENIFKGG
jgi:hypothetical protein